MPCAVKEGVLCFAVQSCVVRRTDRQITEYIIYLVLLMRGNLRRSWLILKICDMFAAKKNLKTSVSSVIYVCLYFTPPEQLN
jgi:hypothetical protein